MVSQKVVQMIGGSLTAEGVLPLSFDKLLSSSELQEFVVGKLNVIHNRGCLLCEKEKIVVTFIFFFPFNGFKNILPLDCLQYDNDKGINAENRLSHNVMILVDQYY